MDNEQIEANKRKAERGWIADPPPKPAGSEPYSHRNKWFRMMGATYLLPAEDNSEKNHKEKT